MSFEQRELMQEFIQKYHEMIKIGKIVTVIDSLHIDYFGELFLVVGFQQDINNQENVVAIMDNQKRIFLVDINKLILMSSCSIDEMFPPKPTDRLIINKSSFRS